LGKKGELLLAAPPPKAKATDAVHKAADVLAAFERAKLSEKPVLLDFSTVWCPPCQTLAAEVLHDPQDADLLSQFEVVVLDADAANSFEWKDRYGVTGYPTLIVANPAGELVGRLMGFDEEQETLDWLAAMAGATSTVSALLGNLDGVSEAALGSSARRLMDEGHDEAAKTLIARIPDEGDRALLSFRLAPSHDLLPILVAQKSPEIMEWIWAVVYELFQQEDIPESSRSLVRQAIVEGLNHVPPEQAAELAYVLADITPDNEHPERIFALGAALYRTAFSGDPVSDRGRTSFLVDLLYRAGNVEGALEVVDAAIVHFPEEFSYHNKRAGVLHDEARLDEALLSAVLATKFAKGDTILRAGMKQAEILAELDRKGEASQVLKSVLDTAIRPKDGQKVRTWRYIELAEAQLKTLGN
jgi:thiol-disulfide isomerase/thioredoxin